MTYTELLKPLENSFIELGYKKISDNNWVCQTQELIVVLSINAYAKERIFPINMGIIFKQIGTGVRLKDILFDYDTHLVQTWFGILTSMGESEEYLNKILSYDPGDNSGFELKNIPVIMGLYKNKIMPYIKELNEQATLVSNFDKQSSWEPFLKYFVPNQLNGPFMNRYVFFFSNSAY